MKTPFLLATCFVFILIFQTPEAYSFGFGVKKDSCGIGNVSVYFTDYRDYYLSCNGIRFAKKFFKEHGYVVDIPITVHFEHPLYTPCFNSECNDEDIYGYCNLATNNIHIRSIASPVVSNEKRKHFRWKYDKDQWCSELVVRKIHASIIVHEVAHAIAEHNFKLLSKQNPATFSNMGRGVHEYIASLVQFEFFDEHEALYFFLKDYELPFIYKEPTFTFDDEHKINSFLYAANPHDFMVKSARHFHSMNEADQDIFIREIIVGEFDPDRSFNIAKEIRENPILCSYISLSE